MNIVWMLLTAMVAFAFGRSILIWGFLGYALGWPVLLVLTFLLGPKAKVWERRLQELQEMSDKLEDITKPKDYKEFNTVDDLFNQLEKK